MVQPIARCPWSMALSSQLIPIAQKNYLLLPILHRISSDVVANPKSSHSPGEKLSPAPYLASQCLVLLGVTPPQVHRTSSLSDVAAPSTQCKTDSLCLRAASRARTFESVIQIVIGIALGLPHQQKTWYTWPLTKSEKRRASSHSHPPSVSACIGEGSSPNTSTKCLDERRSLTS